MSKPLDLETQRPYALDQLTQLQSQIMQSAQGMVVQRARIEKYRQSDLAAARDTYTELEQIRRNLTEQITAAQLFLLELEEYKLASMAGQLCRGISGFNLMSTGYKPIYEVLSKFAAAFPTGQKTNAAVVGRLMNNIKLGYYPTDPDNISLMLRAIRFPDGVRMWQEKIKDTFLFYVVGASHSVFDVAYYFGIDSVKIDITLSPDCYEPLLFLNSIINMILYCQKEVRRLEAERNEQHLIFNGKEAA